MSLAPMPPVGLTYIGVTLLFVAASANGSDPRTMRIHPASIELSMLEASEQLLVSQLQADGIETDITRHVSWSFDPPGIATISKSGRITPIRDGHTILTVHTDQQEQTLPVTVNGLNAPQPVSFRHDVIPILSKAGCNSGGCHGKAEGQNGFRLSVFGYDTAADYDAIVKDGRSRRIFPAAPEHSLLLTKATSTIPHGGGRKIERDSRWHRLLRRWISEGMRPEDETTDPVVEIRVEPLEVVLSPDGRQQLRIVARSQLGISRCVTVEADFQSNNDVVASVNRDGLIQATGVPGEAAVLVRYLNHVAICRIISPQASPPVVRPPEVNFVDQLVWDKLQRLRVAPSTRADDATFLRRVCLDTIGTLPTAEQARNFLTDHDPQKRSRLIDSLLVRPEYADYWAQRWSDLLQADKDAITPLGAITMSRWLREQIQQNVPYDQFVRAILTAQGSTVAESPAAFYQVQSDAEKAGRAVSQLFLGIRIECAECHHHPFERWDQPDYYAWAGFFNGIDRKASSGGAVKIISKAGSDLQHPRTGIPIPAAALGVSPTEIPAAIDRRQVVADWITSPENPYFARTIVNRLVAHYFGRGLVEPIDDQRATNPASNEPLMQALAEHLIEEKFDQRELIRTLLNSNVYQLNAEPVESNRLDEQNYSHAAWRPLPAEVLLDAISQVTGVPEQFIGWPVGYRAIQIWDNKLPSHFLQVFGRPTRQSVCACERGSEPSMAQALHLMNSETTTAKIRSGNGLAAQLARSSLTNEQIVEELYLAALTRFPQQSEQQLMLQVFTETDTRRTAVEDILWTLLNTREFVFNH